MDRWIPRPALLPLLALALVLPAVLGFWLGGPALGFTLAGLTLLGVVVFAVGSKPGGPIELADEPEHPLAVFALEPISSPEAAQRVAELVEGAGSDVLLVAPAPTGRLQEWLSDVDPGRERARHLLDESAAALAQVGLSAETRVGEAGFEQTVEDTLRNRGAEAIAIVGANEETRRQADRLGERIAVPVHLIGG